MPRLELKGWREEDKDNLIKWMEESGEVTTTYDFCESCASFIEGSPLDTEITPPKNGEPEGRYWLGGDVEHPPYSDGEYFCDYCWEILTDSDS